MSGRTRQLSVPWWGKDTSATGACLTLSSCNATAHSRVSTHCWTPQLVSAYPQSACSIYHSHEITVPGPLQYLLQETEFLMVWSPPAWKNHLISVGLRFLNSAVLLNELTQSLSSGILECGKNLIEMKYVICATQKVNVQTCSSWCGKASAVESGNECQEGELKEALCADSANPEHVLALFFPPCLVGQQQWPGVFSERGVPVYSCGIPYCWRPQGGGSVLGRCRQPEGRKSLLSREQRSRYPEKSHCRR